MHNSLPETFRRRLVPLCVAGAIAGATPLTAGALELFAEAEYSLGGGGPTTITDGPDGTSVDVLHYDSDVDGNSVFFHVYGNSGNVFGSRSSGEGTFDALGTFTLTETIENSSGAAQEFFLDFTVDAGTIRVDCFGGSPGCAAGEGGSASYGIVISVGGSSVATSSASVSVSDTASGAVTGPMSGEFMLSGVSSGSNDNGAFYSWNQTSIVQSLGLLAPGTHELVYELVTHATGTFGFGGSDCYGGYNQEIVERPGGDQLQPEGAAPSAIAVGGCRSGSAEARSGDPFNILGPSTSSPFATIFSGAPLGPAGGGIIAGPTAALPEPASTALLGLGLAGFGLRRLRRRPYRG